MTDPLDTPLCELLGIRHAILLAAMAGGPNTPELVAAVTARRRPRRARRHGHDGRRHGRPSRGARSSWPAAAPVGVNVQLAAAHRGRPATASASPPCWRRSAPSSACRPSRPRRRRSARRWSCSRPASPPARRVITTFEDPDAADPDRPQRPACRCWRWSRTSPTRAARWRPAPTGVIAQGTEAGGHRSAFADGETVRSAPEVGTLALVPQVVDAVGDARAGGRDRRHHGRPRHRRRARARRGGRVARHALPRRAAEAGIADVYRRALAVTPSRTARSSPTRHRPPGALDQQPARRRARGGRRGHARLGRPGRADRRPAPRGGPAERRRPAADAGRPGRRAGRRAAAGGPRDRRASWSTQTTRRPRAR